MSISIVIVTYNSAEVIERCLRSCAGWKTVVVDNASGDGTLEIVRRMPSVSRIENSRNAGFAAAANQGIAHCGDEFILLLNPDVELLGSPEALLVACQETGAGIVAGRLMGEDGFPQRGFTIRRFPTPAALAFEVLGWNRMFPGNWVNQAYRYLDRDLSEAGDVDQPAGAFVLVRRALWERLGGFDERFHPVWFEDVDFCKRASEIGSRIYYLPVVTAKHTGGHSVRGVAWECREVTWYVSLLRYASKHFRPLGRLGVGIAVIAGSLIRALISIARRRSLKPVAVYGKVSWLAARCWFVDGMPREWRGSRAGQIQAPETRK